jgi:hypothetical protein
VCIEEGGQERTAPIAGRTDGAAGLHEVARYLLATEFFAGAIELGEAEIQTS